MALYVIADLHLQEQSPELLQAFHNFVSCLNNDDELYIIGDLFNVYVGLDPEDKAQDLVRTTLNKASSRGVQCFFIHGNRDFLMNTKEAQYFGLQLLPDVTYISAGHHIGLLLTHGDLLCTNDQAYQAYRRKVSNRLLQWLFRRLPLKKRRQIGHNIRAQSKDAESRYRDPAIYGIAREALERYCKDYKDQGKPISFIVHGHIHEFSSFHNEVTGLTTRFVLGAWGSHYSYFKLDRESGVCALKEEPIESLLSELSSVQHGAQHLSATKST